MSEWKLTFKGGIRPRDAALNILLYADDATLTAGTESDFQTGVYSQSEVCKDYSIKISSQKPKTIASLGNVPILTKIF